MKHTFIYAFGGLALLALTPIAADARTDFNVTLGLGVPLYVEPPPIYYEPPPRYYSPAPPLYYGPRVIYQERRWDRRHRRWEHSRGDRDEGHNRDPGRGEHHDRH